MKNKPSNDKIPHVIKSWIIISLTILFATPVIAATADSNTGSAERVVEIENSKKELIQKIDSYLTKISKQQFSGAVLVDYKGEKILSKGYGQADRENSIAYTPNTISDIGSVTKQFTAAAILKLEMQGKLSLSDTLAKHFPNTPKDKANITLHEVMNMSAGFHPYSDTEGDYEAVKKQDFIDIVMAQKLLFTPGSSWEYSNTSYSLLAFLIEQVSGQSYETYLYENLFKPAGMEKTGYSRPKFDSKNVAIQHRDAKAAGKPTEKPWDGSEPYFHLKGNGGMLSTTEDLYKWHQALLTDKILSKQAKAKYFQGYIKAWEGGSPDSYAYGWFIRNTPRNTKLIHHSGGNGSAFSYFYRFIDEDVTFIVVCNDHDGFNAKIDDQIKGLLFDFYFKPLEKTGYISLATLVEQGMTIDEMISFIEAEQQQSSITKSKYNLSQGWINHFGYSLVKKGTLNDALKVFRLNVELFPKSPDAYDSFAETLMSLGKVKEGVTAYKKALKLEPQYGNAQVALDVVNKY